MVRASIVVNSPAALKLDAVNPATSTVTYEARDGYGGYASRTVTVTVSANETRSVGENSPAGTPVGEPVTGTPYDDGDDQTDDALTYTLTGEAATSGNFEIDSATGQISVAEGAALLYDTKSSYTGQVNYTVQGQPAAIDVTIELTQAPTVAIELPETFKKLQPMNVTFRFGSDVTGFDASDVTVANGTLGTLSGSGAVYTATVTPNGDGDVTVTVAADAAAAAGSSLTPLTATAKTSSYLWLRIEGPSGTRKSWDSFEVVATFSQPPGDDFSFRPWNSTTPVPVSIDGNTATFTLTPEYYGYRWGTWAYRTRIWVNWRGLGAYFEVYSDADPPRVHRIMGPTETQTGPPFKVHVQLTEDVVNIDAEDLTVVNGKVTGLRRVYGVVRPDVAGWFYEADITPTRSGRLTVDIAAGRFQDGVGWDNTAARQWSVNVDLSPPAPDQPSVTQSESDSMTMLDVTWTAPDTGDGLPVIDYDVWYRKQGEVNWTDHPFTGTATQTTLTGLTSETTYEVVVRARNSDSPGAWSPPGEGATAGNNRLPQFTNQNTARERSVPENSPPGTLIGEPVDAIDHEGQPLTYTLREASALFDVDPATGQLSVAEGALLDFESGESYTVVIEVSDGLSVTWVEDDQSVDAEVTVTITVTDVAEPPARPDAPLAEATATDPATSLDVNWSAIAVVGTPATTDYDVRFRATGTSDWITHPFDGPVPGTVIGGLEPGTVYELQVLARNDEGESPWSESGIGITGPATLNANRQVSEDAPAGAPVGAPVTATGSRGYRVSYVILRDTAESTSPYTDNTGNSFMRSRLLHSTGGGHAEFTIDGGTGQIRLAAGSQLDHSIVDRYRLKVRASYTVPGPAGGQVVNAIIDVIVDVVPVDDSQNPPSDDAADDPSDDAADDPSDDPQDDPQDDPSDDAADDPSDDAADDPSDDAADDPSDDAADDPSDDAADDPQDDRTPGSSTPKDPASDSKQATRSKVPSPPVNVLRKIDLSTMIASVDDVLPPAPRRATPSSNLALVSGTPAPDSVDLSILAGAQCIDDHWLPLIVGLLLACLLLLLALLFVVLRRRKQEPESEQAQHQSTVMDVS